MIQLFDIFDIYLKDKIYPNTWPAISRQNDRDWRHEKAYKSWLPRHGSEEEKEHYKWLLEEDPVQARKFAVSRLKQIEIETDYNKFKFL